MAGYNFIDLVNLLLKDSNKFIEEIKNKPDLINLKYADNESLISFIATEGHADKIALLVELGCDINCQDNLMETPLHEAILSKNVECVRELLSLGANTKLRNLAGLNALDWAQFLDVDQEIIKMIFKHDNHNGHPKI